MMKETSKMFSMFPAGESPFPICWVWRDLLGNCSHSKLFHVHRVGHRNIMFDFASSNTAVTAVHIVYVSILVVSTGAILNLGLPVSCFALVHRLFMG